MSYARFLGGSQVYVYLHVHGSLCCQAYLLKKDFGSYYADTTEEMVGHLEAHKLMGHEVPDSCFEGLKEDQEENDKWIREYPSGSLD